MIPPETHLQIGSLLFDGLDQIDLTGPFEVLSRIPNVTYRVYARTIEPVRDVKGLRLTPDATLADAPQLDVLHVPGGFGQEAAGVTAGIDGALQLAAELRGDDVARAIQLNMQYAPEPPFDSGTPERAPGRILDQAKRAVAGITAQREATARRVAARLGIAGPKS
jgi:transcriptional regulator GlxA family with amidase domain